jgi:hypothetical protein
MSEEQLRKELRASFKNRAILYYCIFDELRQQFGEKSAIEVMKRAIYRRGQQVGKQFAEFAPNDLEGLKSAFLRIIPEGGRMFEPRFSREPVTIEVEVNGDYPTSVRAPLLTHAKTELISVWMLFPTRMNGGVDESSGNRGRGDNGPALADSRYRFLHSNLR